MSIAISSHSANETKITNSQIASIKTIKYKTWTEYREQLFKDSQKWIVASRLGRDQNLKYHWTNNEFTIPNHYCPIARGKWPPGHKHKTAPGETLYFWLMEQERVPLVLKEYWRSASSFLSFHTPDPKWSMSL